MAHHAGAAESFRGPPQPGGPAFGQFFPQTARLRRPGFPGRGRLHGPGQLGDRPRRRLEIQLLAPRRHHDVEPDGDPAPGAFVEARHRHRPRPRPGLPRSLQQAGLVFSLGHLRDRDRGLRPRGSHRVRHRAESALRPSAAGGRVHHLARCAVRPVSPEQGISLHRGAGHHAHRHHRRLFRVGDRRVASKPARHRERVHPVDGDRERSRHALHRHRHPGRDRDAAQSLPPFLHRADAPLRAELRGQTRGDQVRHDRFHGRAHVRALHQRRHPHRRRRDLLHARAQRRRRNPGRLQVTHAAPGRNRREHTLSPWRFSLRGKTPRSPGRWPARS